MERFGRDVPSPAGGPPPFDATIRRLERREDARVSETGAHPPTHGQPLSTPPLWLAEDLAAPLELEPSHEETCPVLRIPESP
jgi:hypothetical protein